MAAKGKGKKGTLGVILIVLGLLFAVGTYPLTEAPLLPDDNEILDRVVVFKRGGLEVGEGENVFEQLSKTRYEESITMEYKNALIIGVIFLIGGIVALKTK